ncbi:MAG: signal peptidase I [Tannerellaceae bacterium]|nr:signal peptidase I [Tannerellaceae bacterium]
MNLKRILKKYVQASPTGGWGMIIVCIIGVVLLIRHFWIGSYRISTHSMEGALHKGDFVLVNKLPVKNHLKRNQIILFRSPLQRDKDNSPLIVSRCVALPGDTIQVKPDGYIINGIHYPRSPQTLSTYTITPGLREPFLNLLIRLGIPRREQSTSAQVSTFILTSFEEYQIREEMNERANKLFLREKEEDYTIIVPRKGQTYRINESFLTASREAIIAEAEQEVTFQNRKLHLDGKETKTFTFNKDYYWVLSDNTDDAVDSRYVGFVPAENIVGKVWFRWLRKDD